MNKRLLKTAFVLSIVLLSRALNAQVTIDSVRHGDALRGIRTGVAQIITNGNFEYPTQAMVYWGGSSNNNNTTPGSPLGSTNACGSNRYGLPVGTVSSWNISGGGASSYPRVDTNANNYSFAAANTGNGGHNLYFGNAGTYEFANTNNLTYNSTTGLVALNGNSFAQKAMFSGSGYGTTPVTLSQTITVVPGSQYLLDFWVSGEDANCGSPSPPGIFQFEIGNQIMYGITGSNQSVYHGNSERYYVYFRSTSSSVTVAFKNWGHLWLNQSSTDLLNVFPTYAYTGCVNGSPFSWCPYTTSELVLDDVIVNTSIPLPLSVEKFAAKSTGTGNEISWRAYDEEKIKQFNVSVSENGRDFKPLQTINAGRGNYFFTDKNLYKGLVYYKLNAEYYTGKEEMSGIALIKNELATPSVLSLSPNPANETLVAHCEVPLQKIIISSTTGQTIKTFNAGGASTDYTLNISDCNKGIYLCQWIGIDGSSTSKLFIKQ